MQDFIQFCDSTGNCSGVVTNTQRLSTADWFCRLHTSRRKLSGLVTSLNILNPEFEERTLNPETSESGEVCLVNDFLSNPDIFPPVEFAVESAECRIESVVSSMAIKRGVRS